MSVLTLKPKKNKLAIFSIGPGKTQPKGTEYYNEGEKVTITFVPDDGCEVERVYVDGCLDHKYKNDNLSYVLVMDNHAHAIRVEFCQKST